MLHPMMICGYSYIYAGRKNLRARSASAVTVNAATVCIWVIEAALAGIPDLMRPEYE
jgi:hypothetical protein